MNEQVLLLSKKHGQLKQAVTKMVQVVMGFLDSTPNLETKLSIIETLRTVTEGKVYDLASPCNHHADLRCRSSLKSNARALPASFRTSRSSRVTSKLPATSCASSKSRRSVP